MGASVLRQYPAAQAWVDPLPPLWGWSDSATPRTAARVCFRVPINGAATSARAQEHSGHNDRLHDEDCWQLR